MQPQRDLLFLYHYSVYPLYMRDSINYLLVGTSRFILNSTLVLGKRFLKIYEDMAPCYDSQAAKLLSPMRAAVQGIITDYDRRVKYRML